jgi:hypothetical protein
MSDYYNYNNFPKYEVNINWIRHGESCANLEEGINNDKKENIEFDDIYDLDYILKLPEEEKNISSEIIKKVVFLYEPNLSFIGMNQAINLGINFFSKNNDIKNIYISSPMTRTITTALLSLRFVKNAVIYVVPYINEKSNIENSDIYDHQNYAIPSNLLKKKIFFIKEWLNEFWITRFDDIEIRNFLKNIYRLTTNIELKNKIYTIFNDRLCKKNNKSFDHKKIQFLINDLICDNNLLNSLDQQNNILFNKILETLCRLKEYKNKFDEYKKGPTVNFEIYEHFENLRKNLYYNNVIPDLTYSNINFFYTNVLNIILRDIRFNQITNSYPKHLQVMDIEENYDKVKIYAFVHGNLMRQILNKYKLEKQELLEIMNTSIITNKILISCHNHIILDQEFFINDYVPEKIRRIDILNFETQNDNVCMNESIKGIINNLDDENNIIKNFNGPDIDFYKKNKDKFNNNLLPSQFGGYNMTQDIYKNKYVKYKNKYLKYKNKYN